MFQSTKISSGMCSIFHTAVFELWSCFQAGIQFDHQKAFNVLVYLSRNYLTGQKLVSNGYSKDRMNEARQKKCRLTCSMRKEHNSVTNKSNQIATFNFQ